MLLSTHQRSKQRWSPLDTLRANDEQSCREIGQESKENEESEGVKSGFRWGEEGERKLAVSQTRGY